MMSEIITVLNSISLHRNHTHHPMDRWSMMGGWWFWIILFIAIFLITVILVYLIIREETGRRKKAEELLDERYARGELNTEEYKEMKKEMRK